MSVAVINIVGPAQRSVRKLIRDSFTRLYLTEAGGWTENPDQGWLLSSSSEAQDVADLLNLKVIEVCFLFGTNGVITAWDFSIPLNPSSQGEQVSEVNDSPVSEH